MLRFHLFFFLEAKVFESKTSFLWIMLFLSHYLVFYLLFFRLFIPIVVINNYIMQIQIVWLRFH